jgi:thioredoxin reductase
VVGLQGTGGRLERLLLEGAPPLECDAMFFNTSQEFRSDLADRLGCGLKNDGAVETDNRQRTCVPGVCFAGDADKDVQFVIVAAGEGATAAVVINRELQDEDHGEQTRPLPAIQRTALGGAAQQP